MPFWAHNLMKRVKRSADGIGNTGRDHTEENDTTSFYESCNPTNHDTEMFIEETSKLAILQV